jgi:putative endopeptidase
MRAARVGVLLVAGCAARDAPKSAFHTPVAAVPSGLEAAWMDTSVDPCVDFYRFACGGWLAHTAPATDGVVSARFSALQARTTAVLRELLEAAAAGQALPGLAAGAPVGDLYASCMSPTVQAQGPVALQAELARLRDAGSRSGVAETIVELEARGIPSVLSVTAEADPTGGPVQVAHLDLRLRGTARLDAGDVRMPAAREAARAEVERTFARAGMPSEEARASADRVMALEAALVAGEPPRDARSDPRKTHHLLPLERVQSLAPSFPWVGWARAVGLPAGARLDVASPTALVALDAQLRVASLETWRAVLRFAVLRALWPALSVTSVPAPRWTTCVRLASDAMPEELGEAFVQRVLLPEDVAAVRLLLGDVEQALAQRLTSAPWMDEATRHAAEAKLRLLVNKVGRPERWESQTGLRLSRESLVGNLLALSRFALAAEVAKVGQPVDRGTWPVSVLSVNAFYDMSLNEVLVPAALLQLPLFSHSFAPAVNLGLLGTVLGHEISHGFDRSGRWRDGSGALHSGWTEASAEAFDGRAACVQAQADATPVLAGVTVNGAATLDEDLADLGGLDLALHALAERQKLRPLLATEGLTPEQQLFLAWGQLWCTKATPEAARALLALDVHAPHPVRVNAPLRNLAAFSQAFGCRPDAPMVATPRCEVW